MTDNPVQPAGTAAPVDAPDAVVTCRDVRVYLPIYSGGARSLKGDLLNRLVGARLGRAPGRLVIVKALDGVSFEAQAGDRIGLLGHNGSGKTTLLKVLAGVYEPSEGEAVVHGKVTPFFDIQVGINNEMTGYEAIKMGCLLREMGSAEIEAARGEIAEFAGLGDFLDLPIRTYSSGMRARLVFAIATCVPPDILLVDEAIGAGDARFMEKVKERVDSYIGSARLLVMASHSVHMLKGFCNRGLVLREGQMLFFGDIEEAVACYNEGRY